MKAYRASSVILLILLLSLVVAGCGGDDNDDDNTVTIRGTVDDGTATSLIANAEGRYVAGSGRLRAAPRTADANGVFSPNVSLEVRGYVACDPPGFPNLTMATFVSTEGRGVGDTIQDQAVTPLATVVANFIA